jgi:formate dehydrogenase alpha subunit
MTNSIPDLEEADLILVTGSNTTEQHPIIGTRILRAQEKGAKLVVVDPRQIQLALHADLWLRQRPGTDVVWLNGMMNVILAKGLEDKGFIEERTEGFEELREVVEAYTPERVEAITGIPRDDLVRAARMYGQANRAAIVYSMGITQHTSGVQHVWSCANLAMLTGNVGRAGTGVNPLRGQNNVQGACDTGALVNVYPGYQSVTDAQIRAKFEKAWGVEGLASEVGLTVVEMMNAAAEGRVKAIYIMGENPVLSDPDSNHVVEALKNLEFLVVQEIFLSETAELADVVLPSASFAEKEGTFTGTDRRVQMVRQAIEPLGECKPDWQIICQLGQRMGASGFKFLTPEEIMDELASLSPIYGGISYERLQEGFLHWPCRSADDPGTPYLHKGEFARGRGLFHAVEHQEAAELPDEDYPLLLTTGRNTFHWHGGTMTRRSVKLDREVPEAYVEVNPEDAERLGLKDGERGRLVSRRGEIETNIWVTERVPQGVVFAPFHFAEAAANVLTNPALDPVAKIPEYKVCAVRLEPIDAKSP